MGLHQSHNRVLFDYVLINYVQRIFLNSKTGTAKERLVGGNVLRGVANRMLFGYRVQGRAPSKNINSDPKSSLANEKLVSCKRSLKAYGYKKILYPDCTSPIYTQIIHKAFVSSFFDDEARLLSW